MKKLKKVKTNKVGAVQIAPNMYVKENNGTILLYSYETPVAGEDHNGAFRTDTQFSSTTTRHINKWLGSLLKHARVVSQDSIYQRAVIVHCM
jgi:hypothetical protein